jgi:Rnl2 family RNA ligase
MPFIKFPSTKSASAAVKCSHISEDWRRREKIHGANFQTIGESGDTNIKFGSRSKELPEVGEPTDFFDFSEIRAELVEYTENLRKTIGPCNVYGELYGGGKKIQVEIVYTEKLKFRVFDVLISPTGTQTYGTWLPYEDFGKVTDAGFSVINDIEFGTLDVLLNRPTEFMSEYADDNETYAEGYTVTKIINGCRYVFKNKAPSFVEKHMGKRIVQKVFMFNEVDLAGYYEIKGFILNKNRLAALNSKIGPPKIDNIPNLARMLVQDAVTDYCADTGSDPKSASKAGFTFYRDAVEFIKASMGV